MAETAEGRHPGKGGMIHLDCTIPRVMFDHSAHSFVMII